MSDERQAMDPNSRWWGEHIFRYQAVQPFVGHEDHILELACGSGFGSLLLSTYTKGKIIAGDLSSEAIEGCKKSFGECQNLEFQILDGTHLPFADRSFDKVISYETIEHTTEYLSMLREFSRVLKKTGTAFISTPNRPINSPGGLVTNPFHTQEFDYDELKSLLSLCFEQVEIYGQAFTRYAFGVSARKTLGLGLERLFYLRGVRKLPLSIKNYFSKILNDRAHYPEPDEFSLLRDESSAKKCSTLLAICRNPK